MLVVGRKQFASQFRWFVATAALTVASVWWYLAEAAGSDRWPGGSSRVGLALGAARPVRACDHLRPDP